MARKKRSTAASRHRAFLNRNRHYYDALFALQGGGCAICGNEPKTRKLDLDHDHKAMEVRGLLCVRCNRNVPDWVTPEWLRACAEYLENPPFSQLI